MVELAFELLIVGLKAYNDKNLNEVIRLKKEWLDEYNKPKCMRINSNLDDIELRLGIIARAFIDTAGKQKV